MQEEMRIRTVKTITHVKYYYRGKDKVPRENREGPFVLGLQRSAEFTRRKGRHDHPEDGGGNEVGVNQQNNAMNLILWSI